MSTIFGGLRYRAEKVRELAYGPTTMLVEADEVVALLDVAEAAKELDAQQRVTEADNAEGVDFDLLYNRWVDLRAALARLNPQ